jgi:ribosomal protein L37AE/L43A
MAEKRPYSNQVNHYCEKCSAWKIHVRGSKYYTCLTCNTKTARGLTQPAPDAGESTPLQALSTPEHSATSQNLSTPTQRG